MEQQKNFKKTCLTLLSIASVLFLIIGIVMVLIDAKYFDGSRYLITAMVFISAIVLITKNKIPSNLSNPRVSLGFIFSTVGLTSSIGPRLPIGMWALGIILFLSGLFRNQVKKNRPEISKR